MPRPPTVIALLALSLGPLAGCYIVSPNAYPAYPPPPPSATPPLPTGLPVPPPGTGSGAPSAGARPPAGPGSGQRCETVLVEGHWETIVRPGRPPEGVWVPPRNVQECR
jgi:hypothetical protein